MRPPILACLALGVVVGCGQATPPLPVAPVPVAPIKKTPPKLAIRSGLPPRPLAIPTPPAPSSAFEGIDLADGRELAQEAFRLATEAKNPREAARHQYWAVKAGAGTEYDLACYTSLAGDVDGGFYWLQQAALAGDLDPDWAGEDADLASLRADRRWKQVAAFLKGCAAYWPTSGIVRTVVVLPKGYQVGTPIGVVVGMHGMGAGPEGYVVPETFQPVADELNMAIVAISGTVPKGPKTFVWSEDPKLDAAHVMKALAGMSDKLTIKPGHLIAMGFSQGAQLGYEVAFQNPDDYRGAIVMSPGTPSAFFRFLRLKPSEKNKSQGFVCLAGDGEHGGNIAFARQDAKFAEDAGARVFLRITEGQKDHNFPPDFFESIARWVRFIDGSDPRP